MTGLLNGFSFWKIPATVSGLQQRLFTSFGEQIGRGTSRLAQATRQLTDVSPCICRLPLRRARGYRSDAAALLIKSRYL